MASNLATRPGYALGMRLNPLPQLWASLEIQPQLLQEHTWWVEKIKSDFNMAPSFFLPDLRKGTMPRSYYDAQNVAYGDFLLSYVASELKRLMIFHPTSPDQPKHLVEEFGIGAGHTMRWLALAHSLGFLAQGWDWVTEALINGAEALEPSFKDFSIVDVEPNDLLHAGEIEEVLTDQVAQGIRPMLRLYARTLHHAKLSRMQDMMYLTGQTADPNGVTTIIHPLPNRKLNQPIWLKYTSGKPHRIEQFTDPYSKGAGQPCIVLRSQDFEFFKWQTLTAFTIGPHYLKAQYELI